MKQDSSNNCKEGPSEIEIIHQLYGLTPPANPHTHSAVIIEEDRLDSKLPGNRFQEALGKANSFSLDSISFNSSVLVV